MHVREKFFFFLLMTRLDRTICTCQIELAEEIRIQNVKSICVHLFYEKIRSLRAKSIKCAVSTGVSRYTMVHSFPPIY